MLILILFLVQRLAVHQANDTGLAPSLLSEMSYVQLVIAALTTFFLLRSINAGIKRFRQNAAAVR